MAPLEHAQAYLTHLGWILLSRIAFNAVKYHFCYIKIVFLATLIDITWLRVCCQKLFNDILSPDDGIRLLLVFAELAQPLVDSFTSPEQGALIK